MDSVYCVFRVSNTGTISFLAACATRSAAERFCIDNAVIMANETIYETRAVAVMKGARSTVIEKVAVIGPSPAPTLQEFLYGK